MLIDTCVMIEYFKGSGSVSEFLKRHSGQLAVSSVTDMEVAQGVRNKKELQSYDRLLRSLQIRILEVDEPMSLRARLWVREFGLSHNLCLADALIAATAFQANLKLISYNIKDFRFLGLDLSVPDSA